MGLRVLGLGFRLGTAHTLQQSIIGVILGLYMGGCQNYGPFLGTLNIRGRIIIGTQKGPIILTSPHMIISYLLPKCHLMGAIAKV